MRANFVKLIFTGIVTFVTSQFFSIAEAQVDDQFNLDRLLQIVDQNKISSMEDALAFLPEELRTHFTLQYEGHGLQQASFTNPRVILFGNDAKFVATFNGHPDQGKYNSLEILQFNQSKTSFELYSLDFPIHRDAYGHAVRPEKNPSACLQCHGSSPHPVWGQYNFWPGIFGAHDDMISKNEQAPFAAFMTHRQASERYRVLSPMTGSAFSPYSSPENQTLSFLPNDILGALFVRLNSAVLAQKMKQSNDSLRYMLLMSPLMYSCKSLLSDEDRAMLNSRLLQIFRARGFKHLPIRGKEASAVENLILLTRSSVGAWGLASETDSFITPYFLDNFLLTTPNYILGQMKESFFKKYPDLSSSYMELPFATVAGVPRLVRTDVDRSLIKTIDALGVGLKLTEKADCAAQIRVVKSEFLH
jgi:hypothetical protein